MIKSVSECIKSIAISSKTCMEQAEIIDMFGTYQSPVPDYNRCKQLIDRIKNTNKLKKTKGDHI